MKYTVTVQSNPPETISVRDLAIGQFGVATTEFPGEVFYRSVNDIIGLSGTREWDEVGVKTLNGFYNYCPDFQVRVIQPGEAVTIRRDA